MWSSFRFVKSRILSLITNSNSPVLFFFLMVLFPGLSPFWDIESTLFPRDGGSWGSRTSSRAWWEQLDPRVPKVTRNILTSASQLSPQRSVPCTQLELREQILWMNKGSESFVVCNRNIFSFLRTTVILKCLSIIFQLLCHYGGTEQFLVSSSALKDITFLRSSHTLWVHITKWSVGANWRVVQLGCLLKISSAVISSWFPYLVWEWPNFWPGTEMRSQSIKKMVGPESHI